MRTTVTLDEDVAAKLKAEARRTGKPFKTVLNECLRVALSAGRGRARPAPFRIDPRDLGALRPGLSLDNVAELLDLVEGPESP
jgi:hypothetical protein